MYAHMQLYICIWDKFNDLLQSVGMPRRVIKKSGICCWYAKHTAAGLFFRLCAHICTSEHQIPSDNNICTYIYKILNKYIHAYVCTLESYNVFFSSHPHRTEPVFFILESFNIYPCRGGIKVFHTFFMEKKILSQNC